MNILEIYNISDSVYLWYNIIIANILLLAILFVVSLIRKNFSLVISASILLLIPLGICIYAIFNIHANSFEPAKRKKIDDLGIVTFNRNNGSYENNNLHIYMTSSKEIEKYVEMIDICTISKDLVHCNIENHSKLLEVFINKKINLEYIFHYLNDYCKATNNNSHINMNINNVGIGIYYTCSNGNILYTIDYLDKYESIEQNEKVRRHDSLVLETYEGYDDKINKYIMNSLGFRMEEFQKTVVNNKYIYTK